MKPEQNRNQTNVYRITISQLERNLDQSPDARINADFDIIEVLEVERREQDLDFLRELLARFLDQQSNGEGR